MNAHTHIDEDTTLMNVNEEDLKRAPNTLLICEEEWRLRYVFRVVLKHPFPCTSWVTFTFFLTSHNVLQFLKQTILKYLFYKYSFYALYPLAGMLRSFNFGFPNACELDIRDAYILSFSIYSENIFIHIKNIHTMHTYIHTPIMRNPNRCATHGRHRNFRKLCKSKYLMTNVNIVCPIVQQSNMTPSWLMLTSENATEPI